MEKTSTTPEEEHEIGLIDRYIKLWKNMKFDFDKPPTSYLTKEDGNDDLYYEMVKLQDSLDIINDLMVNDQYKLKEGLKIVHAEKQQFMIQKFNVKGVVSKVVKTVEAFVYIGLSEYELIEWRFKDTCETACPDGRGRVPCPEIAPEDTPRPSIPPPSAQLVTRYEDPYVKTSKAPTYDSDDELVTLFPEVSETSSREVPFFTTGRGKYNGKYDDLPGLDDNHELFEGGY